MSEPTANPYPAGAVSRFVAWVDGLPWHGWWVYPGIVAVLFLWGHGVLWASGVLPFGAIDPLIAVGVAYGPFTLAALAYLNGVAARAIAAFWPATGWPEAERAAWTYRFVTTPGGYGWWCLVFGVVVAIGAYVGAPPSLPEARDANRALIPIAYLPTLLMGYSMLPAALVHAWRQLRLVARIHREARAIDPFDRGPVYAFSRLTAQAGLVFLVVAYYSLTVNGSFQAGNLVSLASIGLAIVLGVACFVVPLWGIHGRLGDEKERLQREVEARISRLGAEMYARIDAGQFEATKTITDTLAGTVTLRERISRLPTWPWPPQVVSGFISALLLPVIVFLVTRVLSSQIGD
ncbi:MAG: hypothetical protein EPO36_05155 [Chloroflexota bacterium]|nr:MAG: hypothetical protein EPO36_05155 [Chloroflexota bacterium]